MSERATCQICPHQCEIAPGNLGICGARRNESGDIVSVNYGMATALALDPIEKKPLARFHPGSRVLSYGSFGCNLRCPFCQNNDIATMRASDMALRHCSPINPKELVDKALSCRDRGNIGVAFTYNEPLISPEYITDAASMLHDAELVSIAVTNGYCQPSIFDRLLDSIDAYNIDLKCFTEIGYDALGAPGGLSTVKRNIQAACDAGKHVEVTTLVVPGISDDLDAFDEECKWLASIDQDIVLHITRFFPRHLMQDEAPTGIDLLKRFREVADSHLRFVLIGNA